MRSSTLPLASAVLYADKPSIGAYRHGHNIRPQVTLCQLPDFSSEALLSNERAGKAPLGAQKRAARSPLHSPERTPPPLQTPSTSFAGGFRAHRRRLWISAGILRRRFPLNSCPASCPQRPLPPRTRKPQSPAVQLKSKLDIDTLDESWRRPDTNTPEIKRGGGMSRGVFTFQATAAAATTAAAIAAAKHVWG